MTTRLTSALLLIALLGASGPAVAQQPAPAKTAALTDAEKLYGLSFLWKEVSYNFPYFDHVPKLDWDKAYQEFIPQVLAAPNTFEYYRVLQRFIALLKDGHSNVYFPPSVREKNPVDLPWISLVAVQRRAIVRNVEKPLAGDLPIGSEILTVDGIPVAEYLERHVLPYVASSTEHILWDSGIAGNVSGGYGLLAGATGTSVRFTARAPDGKVRSLAAARDRGVRRSEWLLGVPPRQLLEFRWLEDSVAYLALNSFGNDSLVQRVDSLMPSLLRARAVVLDLRFNGGGNTSIAKAILGRLTSDTLLGSAYRTRTHTAAHKAWGRLAVKDTVADLRRYAKDYLGDVWFQSPPDTLMPGRAPTVTAPIAVLIGHATAAAAEDFLIYLDKQARFTLVGEPTFGSTGQPLLIDLPGGGVARVVTKRDTYPDGRDFVGVGVRPEIAVEATVDDVRTGRDPVLERAARLFQRPAPARPVRK